MKPLAVLKNCFSSVVCSISIIATLAALPMAPSVGQQPSRVTAIVGATVVDTRSSAPMDIEDAVVVIRDGQIVAVGGRNEIAIPDGATLIKANGQYLVPGLIDGFATLNGQSYANAFLHEGVTSIVGLASTRRGPLVRDCQPSPHIYELDSIGDEDVSTADALSQLQSLHDRGVKIALLMYRLKPDQIRALIARARELNMGTIGELAETTYAEGIDAGLDALVHTTRYSLDMAPAKMRKAVGLEPFSDQLDSPKWQYYMWLSRLKSEDHALNAHAKTLSKGPTALMPTAALLYLDQSFAKNPWHEPVAKIIPRGLVDSPANEKTGRHVYDPERIQAYAAIAKGQMTIEKAYFKAGATYIAGSATDVWGTMPGISLHQELELMTRIGLTPREALAAATFNIAKAFRWKNIGRIQPQARADLLVLDADPRKDIGALKQIDLVILKGKVIQRASLLAVPAETDKPNGTILSQTAFEIPNTYHVDDDRSKPFRKQYDYLSKVAVHRISYASDGLRVTGYLARPRKGDELPSIIYNRGGNRDFGALNPHKVVRILAKMASWGYVVVGSQYRGTDGSDGMEQFGGEDVNDVLNLLPLIDNHPNADGQRIGMVGGSRGGMMTYLTLTKTDRIRAAAIRCGVTDLTQWTDERPGMVEVFNDLIPGFDPKDPTTLQSRSAVFWVDKLPRTTPILILQGTADWRVSPKSALDMGAALLARHHPFRLVMLEGSDHSLSEHSAEASQLIRNWLNRFVRDRDALPNTNPHGR